MKLQVLFVLTVAVALTTGQLIIDEDDPEGKRIISLLMKAIDASEKTEYTFVKLIYTLGDDDKYSVYLEVSNNKTKVRKGSKILKFSKNFVPGTERMYCGAV